MTRLRMELLEAPAFSVRRRTITQRVIPAVAGDVVTPPGEPRAVVVAGRCDGAIAFVCLTHQQRLANEFQLKLHAVPGSGQHVIARECRAHGPEEL